MELFIFTTIFVLIAILPVNLTVRALSTVQSVLDQVAKEHARRIKSGLSM